jgi:ATP-dependent Clp protease ATP-binding subunit ClpA
VKAGKTITVDDDALELVVVKGFSMAFGARFLKRFIDEHIKLPISAQWKAGSHFDVKARDGQLVVEPGLAKVSAAAALGDVV